MNCRGLYLYSKHIPIWFSLKKIHDLDGVSASCLSQALIVIQSVFGEVAACSVTRATGLEKLWKKMQTQSQNLWKYEIWAI